MSTEIEIIQRRYGKSRNLPRVLQDAERELIPFDFTDLSGHGSGLTPRPMSKLSRFSRWLRLFPSVMRGDV